MRKVYASFYNLNAYLERLRHGVNEAEVGMALWFIIHIQMTLNWPMGVRLLFESLVEEALE